MKNLQDFVSEKLEDEVGLLFESLDENCTLQECFERIGDAMIADAMMNEGLFSKIGKKLAEWGKKAAESGESADKKISKLSADVKKAVDGAIAKTKEKAGDAWDNMKETYTNVVASVAQGIENSKEAIAGIAKQTGAKIEDLTATVSNVVSNGIAKGKESISKALDTPVKMAAMATLIGAAQACQKHGLDILDILTAAGIK